MKDLQVEIVHLRADFEAVRASARNQLLTIMPSLRDVASALDRPMLSEDKRKFLAQVLSERLDVIQELIAKLDAAKAF